MSDFDLQKDPLRNNTSEPSESSDKPEELEAAAEEHETAAEPKTEAASDNAPAQPAKPMKAWPWMAISFIAIVALIVVLVRESGGGGMNKAVGEVGGVKITQSQLYADLEKTSKSQLGQQLDSLLLVKMVDAAADKAGIQLTDADMNETMKQLMKQYGFNTEDEFSQALTSSGTTLEDFKEQSVKPQAEIEKIFEANLKPTDEQLKDYYEKNKANFATTPEQVKASHILVKTKEEAEAILKQLKQGADFATLAKEKSTDTATKDNGGDLGYFGRNQMEAAFETAAFSLKKGELSDVVQTQYGYHIIKVIDHKDAAIPSYDEAKADVKYQYLNEKINEGFNDWLTKTKKDLGYKNYLTEEDASAAEESPAPSATASSSPAASEPASGSPSASPSASANP